MSRPVPFPQSLPQRRRKCHGSWRARARVAALVRLRFSMICCVFVPFLDAGEWSRFRGPNGGGVSSASGLPMKFHPEEGFLWKKPTPPGHSSPVLTTDRVFLTGYEGEELLTLALERHTGALLWRRNAPRPREEKFHRLNGPASTTPVTDGEAVFVFFGDYGLLAYERDGRERWRRPLGPFLVPNGHASSPILAGRHLILQVDQDRGSYLMALDPRSGAERWKIERPDVTHGYSTPAVFTPRDGEPQLIVTSSYQATACALDSGKKLWWVGGIAWQIKPSVAVAQDTVFISGSAPGGDPGEQVEMPPFEEALRRGDADGDHKLSEEEVKAHGWRHGGGWGLIDLDDDGLLGERDWNFYRARRGARNTTLALRPGAGRGDLTDAVLWRYRKAVPEVPSPVYYDGVLYTLKKGGILTALDGDTGKVLKQARLGEAIGEYYASPIVGDAKLYLLSEDGEVSVVRPGADWEVISRSDLGELCYATPAIADGAVYMRTASHLYAFVEK